MKKKSAEFPLATAYLEQVRTAKHRLETLRQKQANLRLLTTDTASHLSFGPRSDSPDLQRNETLIAEIESLEEQIILAEREFRKIATEVGLTICMLKDPIVQQALILHYLSDMEWKEVAKEIKYSRNRTYELRDKGLRELENLDLISSKVRDASGAILHGSGCSGY